MKFNNHKPMGSTLSMIEAAGTLNVHPNTVARLIDSGELPAAKIGRSYVLLYKDVMDYIERLVIRQTAARLGGEPIRRARRSPKLVGQV